MGDVATRRSRRSRARASLTLACLVVAGCGSTSDDSGTVGAGPDAGADAASEAASDAAADTSADVTADGATDPSDPSVVTFHARATRDGVYVQPTLTRARAATLARDATFDGTVSGKVRAQPLFVDAPGGHGRFLVVTDRDEVDALDETTGAVAWTRDLGPSAAHTGAGCGNVVPVGATSTPAIDLATRTAYVALARGTDATASSVIATYEVHALSLDDGSERAGWPVDLGSLHHGAIGFDARYENQRGALLLQGGTLYVPFGGHYGDCGPYHGYLVALDVATATVVGAYATAAEGGGSWAVGGPAGDGASVFVTTGNTKGAAAWGGGEAVLRFPSAASLDGDPADLWVPTNWQQLDAADVDIGGTGALLLDVAGATPSALVMAMGKDGELYLLDRAHLGGLASAPLAHLHAGAAGTEFTNAPAAFTTSAGTFVAFRHHDGGSIAGCPNAVAGADLGVVRVTPTAPPTLALVWCATSGGYGSPMVTMTDAAGADAIVWAEGAEGDERLRGWDGATGALVYAGGGAGDALGHTQHFTTPIAVRGRVVVGSDGKLNVFSAP